MTPNTIAKKFFRELANRQFKFTEVAEVLIQMTAFYIVSLAAERPGTAVQGVDAFADEVKKRIAAIQNADA